MIKVVLNIKKRIIGVLLHAAKDILGNKQHLESLGKFLKVAIGEPGTLKKKKFQILLVFWKMHFVWKLLKPCF